MSEKDKELKNCIKCNKLKVLRYKGLCEDCREETKAYHKMSKETKDFWASKIKELRDKGLSLKKIWNELPLKMSRIKRLISEYNITISRKKE